VVRVAVMAFAEIVMPERQVMASVNDYQPGTGDRVYWKLELDHLKLLPDKLHTLRHRLSAG
jgi:hypothetical protein